MREFHELWPGGPVFAQAAHFPLGTDSVLLAAFTNVRGVKKGIDLGCGSGVLALLLLSRAGTLSMTGLELLAESAETARDNLAANGLLSRGEIVCGDIREVRSLFRGGAFDLVVANPPYYPVGSGALPADPAQAAARGEISCTLDELCAAAGYLCRSGGRFCLVHKPERLCEVFAALRAHGLEPKRLRLVCADTAAAPSLILLEARRGGRPGLAIEPALFLSGADGSESEELKAIYHRE
ncbi:MAG: methyltransferase [Oscillospiraceae bacterium]|nr:methyltransferase [Oscillospiraceae bacterium]